MIISIDVEKVFDKIQHRFMLYKKAGIKKIYLKIIKAIPDKLTASIIPNTEKLKAFSQNQETRMSTLTTFCLFVSSFY